MEEAIKTQESFREQTPMMSKVSYGALSKLSEDERSNANHDKNQTKLSNMPLDASAHSNKDPMFDAGSTIQHKEASQNVNETKHNLSNSNQTTIYNQRDRTKSA